MDLFPRRLRRLAAAVLMAALCAGEAAADQGNVRAGVLAGVYIPILSYAGVEKFHTSPGAAYGVLLGYDFTDQAGFEFNYLRASGRADLGGGSSAGLAFDDFMADAAWSVLTGVIRPRFLAGLDAQMIHAGGALKSESAFGAHFGLSLVGVLKPYLHLGITARYHYLVADRFRTDNAVSMLASFAYLF